MQREGGEAAVAPTAFGVTAQLQWGTAGHVGSLSTAPFPRKSSSPDVAGYAWEINTRAHTHSQPLLPLPRHGASAPASSPPRQCYQQGNVPVPARSYLISGHLLGCSLCELISLSQHGAASWKCPCQAPTCTCSGHFQDSPQARLAALWGHLCATLLTDSTE